MCGVDANVLIYSTIQSMPEHKHPHYDRRKEIQIPAHNRRESSNRRAVLECRGLASTPSKIDNRIDNLYAASKTQTRAQSAARYQSCGYFARP